MNEQLERIAQTTQRLLENQNLLLPDSNRTVFYVWPRAGRAVLIFDSLALRRPEEVVSRRFTHRLSTALGGNRVVATNSRGIFLQVGYSRPSVNRLDSRSLDLSRQPGPLHVPIGETRRGPLWLSIVEMDSVLIGGTRRMGKTNLLHTWILALLHGREALLVLWDGKQGTEFGRYAGRSNALVVDDLTEGIRHLLGELSRRRTLFRQEGAVNLSAYNQESHAKLAPLVLVVDEAALIPEDLQDDLSKLIAVGGAYGLHPVIATQRPDAKAVQSMLKANLATRIALPVPSHHDSQVILGRTGAERLPNTKGRLLLVWNARLVEAQAYIAPLENEAPRQSQSNGLLSEREVRAVRAALEQGGWFRVREIAAATGESKEWVNDLAKRWQRCGYLTAVQRNEKGHPQGRRVTDTLLQAAGLGESGDLADQADLADWVPQ